MKKVVVTSVVMSAVVALAVGVGIGWGIARYPAAAAGKSPTPAENTVDDSNSIFVSLPEIIVTLHDDAGADRYMVAEVVMVADSKETADKIKKEEPLYQSITVSLLSDMKYEEIRAMKISEIRGAIARALKNELTTRKLSMPYKDILLQKVVFQ